MQQPDRGSILHKGQPAHLENPAAARHTGIATVYQEFSLVPYLTVAENISLGQHPKRGGRLFVDWSAVTAAATAILGELGLKIDPKTKVADLSVAEQQLVEIAKALSQNANLLILDEPTTALGQHEIHLLHGLLRSLKDRGVAILYISHRLDEVVELVDSFTVLKDGRVVSASGETRLDVNEIVSRMIGSDIEEHFPKERNATTEVVLEAAVWQTATPGEGRDVRRAPRRGGRAGRRHRVRPHRDRPGPVRRGSHCRPANFGSTASG